MKPTLLLRTASVLTMIHCLLHTIGGVFGAPKYGAEQISVIETMKAHQFNVFGSMRSYWDFFFGYGLFVTVFLFIQAIFFWQLAAWAKSNPVGVRFILALFCVNFLAMAIVSWRYFFIAPAVTELLIAVCLGMAYSRARAIVA
jgi:hypothetical protein